jgi:hypothetical protein
VHSFGSRLIQQKNVHALELQVWRTPKSAARGGVSNHFQAKNSNRKVQKEL